MSALRNLKESQNRMKLESGTSWLGFTSANGVKIDLVFCQPNGLLIDSRKDWGDWKSFLTKAGVPMSRVHDARHTAATTLLLMGVNGRIVMEMMGGRRLPCFIDTSMSLMR